MTSKPLDDDVLAETLAASRNYNTIKEASEALGLARSTYEHRLKIAMARVDSLDERNRDNIVFPDFPVESDESDELLSQPLEDWALSSLGSHLSGICAELLLETVQALELEVSLEHFPHFFGWLFTKGSSFEHLVSHVLLALS